MLADAHSTLSEWVEGWVNDQQKFVRPSTISGYRTDLLYVDRSGLGRIPLNRLQASDLNGLFDWVIASGRNRGTQEHLKRTLNPALNAAVASGHLPANPLARVVLRGEPGPVETPYGLDEIGRLLLAARHRRNGPRWVIALLGLCQGEALGLRWADVDLDQAEMTVRSNLRWRPWLHGCVDQQPAAGQNSDATCGRKPRWCPRRHSGGPYFMPVNTLAGNRVILLPGPVTSRLREHRARQDSERLAAGSQWSEHDCVFASKTGSPIDRTTDREEWLDVIKAAPVRPLRIHDLRHTAAAALLALGEDSRTVTATMGWSTPSLVARYAHAVPDLRRRVASKQAALFAVPNDDAELSPAESTIHGSREMR